MLEHGKDFKRATAGISQPGTTVALRQFHYQQRKGTQQLRNHQESRKKSSWSNVERMVGHHLCCPQWEHFL